MLDLAKQIEVYLLERGTWVPARELEERFGVDQRKLRAQSGNPGLCSVFAISSSAHGYKHVRCATDEEFLEAHKTDRKTVASRFITLRQRANYRKNCLTGDRQHAFEVHSGQGFLGLKFATTNQG